MKAAPKPEGGGSPETAGTGGSGGTRKRREREGKGKRDIGVESQLVVTSTWQLTAIFKRSRQVNDKR